MSCSAPAALWIAALAGAVFALAVWRFALSRPQGRMRTADAATIERQVNSLQTGTEGGRP